MARGEAMAKDNWDKFDILAKLAVTACIAIIGIRYTTIYQEEQNKINKTKIETEILKAAIKGDEEQRNIALVLAPFIAKRFDDKEFEDMILQASFFDGNYESVRLLAQERRITRSLESSKPDTKEILRRELSAVSLRRALNAADNYFKVEAYTEAALEYEKATSLVPQGATVDLNILKGARQNLDDGAEVASRKYRQFFSKLRNPLSPGDMR